jgi:glycosyltransferase involved in cell wall biosynthesis
LITALVSTYNSGAFIRECLEDLEGQTIADRIEIIVVDAASQENEKSVVEEFQKKYSNIVYVRTGTRISVYQAWNISIKIAGGKYLTTFSTNDRLRKDAYEIMFGKLEENPGVSLVYGDSYLTEIPHETFDRHTCAGFYNWKDFTFEDLLNDCLIGPHPMWRKSVHDALGYFDENFVALGDQEFWLRLGETHKILHFPEFTGLYWVTPESISRKGKVPIEENYEIRVRYQKRYMDKLVKAVKFGSLYKKRLLYIWGASDGGKKTLTMLRKMNITPDGFIDSSPDKWNLQIDDLGVLPPYAIEEQLSLGSRPFIIIASMYQDEIKPELLSLGYKERVDFWTNIYVFSSLNHLHE